MTNKPNYNRKYKIKFHILLVMGICCILFLGVNPFIERIISNKESKMVEGKDYFQETIVIDKKEIKKEVNITIYDFFSTYTNGKIDRYYYIYSNAIEVLTDQVTYDELHIGDNVNVYRSISNKYFTSLTMAKRDNIDTNIEILFLSSILIPVLGLLLLVYLFVLRESLKNPYYSKWKRIKKIYIERKVTVVTK